MKTIKILFLSALFITAFSCVQEKEDVLTGTYSSGGELNVPASSGLISYVLGEDATYTGEFFIPTSQNPTTSVDVYKQYLGVDGSVSNKELLVSIPIDGIGTYSYDFNYADLISDLEIDGVPLPTSDSGLAIADEWLLTYTSNTADGGKHVASGTTSVAVGTRLAGIYDITFSEYHHWNGNIYDHTGQGWTRTIKSVNLTEDYTIYNYSNVLFDYWADAKSNFYFYVYNDPIEEGGNEYRIEIPKEYNGETQALFVDGLELATCTDLDIYDPVSPPFIWDCDDNYVSLSEDGHDVIHITYGYITSGIRITYEEDTKQ